MPKRIWSGLMRRQAFRSWSLMFHRAIGSAAPAPASRVRVPSDQTKRGSQSCYNGASSKANSPLASKSPSHRNVVKSAACDKVKFDACSHNDSGHKLLDAIMDNSVHRYDTPEVKTASAAVYFNEDDFDDDLEMTFETVAEPLQGQIPASSPAISWSASSHLERSPMSFRGMLGVNTGSTVDSTSDVNRGNNLTHISNQTDGCTAPRRSRPLPWSKNTPGRMLEPQHGALITQRHLVSSSAAIKEEETDLDLSTNLPKRDIFSITENDIKTVLKSRGKKRGIEEVAANASKSSTNSDVAKVFLSAEQRGVIEMLKTGKSVFFTGSAGTGKSVLLRTAIQELRLKHKQLERVAVTASTGLAACNIGGITLHSFAGVGLGRDSVAEMVKKVKKNKKSVLKWTKTKVLIIDEISMVDADFYDKLESVARKVRGNERPWGGIQIVATGDFFQLPPVPDQGKVAKFAFEAEQWKTLDATIQLTTVFRQKDQEFVQMLNQMRTGLLTDKTIRNFKALQRPLNHDDGIIPTELFPTRNEVDTANAARMKHLPGSVHTFEAEDSGSILDSQQRSKLLSNCMAPPRLDLKVGAQVMLIKNRDEGLVNGSLGVVVGFMNEKTYTYATEGGASEFDSSLLRDSPWTDSELAVMDQSPAGRRKFSKMLDLQISATNQKMWPIVRFKSPNGGQDMTQLMSPESWKIEQPNGDVQACRKQVPLILAYAISIHKAQGQTIERVKVDLGKVFEKGQAYVALSRAVSKEGLQILRFDVKRVMAHPKVAAFYRELVDASTVIGDHNTPRIGAGSTTLINDETTLTSLSDSMTTQEVFSQAKRNPVKAYQPMPKHTPGRMAAP